MEMVLPEVGAQPNQILIQFVLPANLTTQMAAEGEKLYEETPSPHDSTIQKSSKH
jgi:hypothetical protein